MHLKASFHNTLGGGIRMGIQLLTIPLLIWQIGTTEYGLWALVSAIMAVVGLIEGGLTVSTTVYASRDLANKDASGMMQTLTITFGSMLVLATVAAGGLWLGAHSICQLFIKLDANQREAAVVAMKFSGLVIWSRLLQQVFVGIEQAYNRYGVMNIVNTGQQVLINVGMLVIALYGGRIVAFMKWQLLVGLVMLCIHGAVAWSLMRPLQLRPQWNAPKAREIINYSLVAWVSMLGIALFSQCDRLVVGSLLGPYALGIYAAVVGITTQINVLSGLPVQPLLPLVSQAAANLKNSAILQLRLRQSMQINAVIAFSAGTVMCLFAPWIVQLLLHEANPETVQIFRVSAAICSIYSLNASGYFILLGMGLPLVCTRIVLLAGLVALSLVALGSSYFGLLGAVCGTAGYFVTLWLIVNSMKRLGSNWQEWLHWLRWPVIWFVLAFSLNWLVPDHLGWKIVLACAELGILGMWWMTGSREINCYRMRSSET